MKMKLEPHPLQDKLVKEPTEPIYAKVPIDILSFCSDILTLPQEAFFVVILNTKQRIVQRRLVSFGLLDYTLVHPREVFRDAIKLNAKSVILVHNHPSGDTTPSAEDVRITRQLVDAGRILDVKVLDHVVVGQDITHSSFCSLRESGLTDFS